MNAATDKVDVEYMMWGRKEVFVQSDGRFYDKIFRRSCGPRIADNM